MGGENEKTIILNVLKKLLKSLEIHGDEGRQMFKSTLAPQGLAIHARKVLPDGSKGKGISYEDFPDGFAGRIPWDDHTTRMVEGLDGDATVLIDHDIAMVWAPYWFTNDGRLSHVGTDIVTLVHRDWYGTGKEEWLIVSATDNARQPTDEDRKRLEGKI